MNITWSTLDEDSLVKLDIIQIVYEPNVGDTRVVRHMNMERNVHVQGTYEAYLAFCNNATV